MGMVVTLFLALATTTVAYAVLGQGGGVAGLIFGTVMLIGATIRVFRPASCRRAPKRASRSPAGTRVRARRRVRHRCWLSPAALAGLPPVPLPLRVRPGRTPS